MMMGPGEGVEMGYLLTETVPEMKSSIRRLVRTSRTAKGVSSSSSVQSLGSLVISVSKGTAVLRVELVPAANQLAFLNCLALT